MTINECLDYIRACGLWVSIVVDYEGEIVVMPESQPNKSADMAGALSLCVSGSDLLQVLNETVMRLQIFFNETGDDHDARKGCCFTGC